MTGLAQDMETNTIGNWHKQHLNKMKDQCKVSQAVVDEQEKRIQQLQSYLKYLKSEGKSWEQWKQAEMEATTPYDGASIAQGTQFLAAHGLVQQLHYVMFRNDVDYLGLAVRGHVDHNLVSVAHIAESVDNILNDLATHTLSDEAEQSKEAVCAAFNTLIIECAGFAAKESSVLSLKIATSSLEVRIENLLRVVKVRPCPLQETNGLDDSDSFLGNARTPQPLSLGTMVRRDLRHSESPPSASCSSSYSSSDDTAQM